MVFIVWTVVLCLAALGVAVPGVRHRRRVQAWERELAEAFARTEDVDLRRPSLVRGPRFDS